MALSERVIAVAQTGDTPADGKPSRRSFCSAKWDLRSGSAHKEQAFNTAPVPRTRNRRSLTAGQPPATSIFQPAGRSARRPRER